MNEAAMTDPGAPVLPAGERRRGRRRSVASATASAPGKGLARIERIPGVSERVFIQLRTAIVERDLPPGAPVVIEQLAEALGVSRTPIREALPALQQLGLIVESGSGSFRVAPLDAAYAREVYAVRSALESLLVEVVAPLLTEGDLCLLRAAATPADDDERPRPAPAPRTGDVLVPDVAFHDVLRARCPLPFLNVLIDSVRVHRARLLDLEHTDDSGYRRESNEEHLAIVAALERRDAQAARRLMQAHLDRVGRAVAGLAAAQGE
jgi:DNA-binding GntR family transcriptional regulator